MAGDDTDTGSVNAMTFVHPAGTSTLPVGAVDQQPGNNQNVFAHPANISGAGRGARRPSPMQVDMAVTDGEESQASTCKFGDCIAVSMFRLIWCHRRRWRRQFRTNLFTTFASALARAHGQ